ncbi:MAG: hypothetical protein COA42_14935 [Alteromonadaceae bacterium]|nr:MAG: hypothetical protein COA42_14935 [Alteromonadaceae bacterium]
MLYVKSNHLDSAIAWLGDEAAEKSLAIRLEEKINAEERFATMGWLRKLFQSFQYAHLKSDRFDLNHQAVQFRIYKRQSQLLQGMQALCERLCDWPLLINISLFQQLRLYAYLDVPPIEESRLFNIDMRRNSKSLALGYFQQGYYFEAKQCIEEALEASPDDDSLKTYGYYLDYQAHKLASYSASQGDLKLVLLSDTHAEDFTFQYADSDIAKLCSLPTFEDTADWFSWLEEARSDSDRTLFAVMHQHWGFIGSVSLEVHEQVGFFYYWLGRDFQGQGLGPKAVRLLLAWGKKCLDLSCCYAKVYDYNMSSQKALSKIGFQSLPFRARRPYTDERFYYFGNKKSTEACHVELANLLTSMMSVLRLMPM